jgi:hypothetical protein
MPLFRIDAAGGNLAGDMRILVDRWKMPLRRMIHVPSLFRG